MHTPDALLDLNERTHRSVKKLLEHCAGLDPKAFNRSLDGFGYPTVRLQLHHEIGAQKYWIGVLEGRIDAEEDDPRYPTAASLETYREEVASLTERYLGGATALELGTPRPMITWGGKERILIPAQVFLRTVTHYYHHQGQITAMCRVLGKPVGGLDYPID